MRGRGIAGRAELGRWLLHTDVNDHAARIVVSDNGPAMGREAISHAFDRPAADSRAPADRGLGLGLPLARQIVEAHGGTVKLISEPGEGTLIVAELAR